MHSDFTCQDQSELTSQDTPFPSSEPKQTSNTNYGLNTEIRLITGHQAKWQFAFSVPEGGGAHGGWQNCGTRAAINTELTPERHGLCPAVQAYRPPKCRAVFRGKLVLPGEAAEPGDPAHRPHEWHEVVSHANSESLGSLRHRTLTLTPLLGLCSIKRWPALVSIEGLWSMLRWVASPGGHKNPSFLLK